MTEAEISELRRRFGREGAEGRLSAQELYDFYLRMQWDLTHFGAATVIDEADPADPRVHVLIDVLGALALLEPDDGAHLWNRAPLLRLLGRHGEAAQDFLAAADRFDAEYARGDGLTRDEDDWAAAARHQAAVSFVRAGEVVAAQTLLPRLDADDRRAVEALLPA